jgi:hypothetical protein
LAGLFDAEEQGVNVNSRTGRRCFPDQAERRPECERSELLQLGSSAIVDVDAIQAIV